MHVENPALNLRFTHEDIFSGTEFYGGTGALALDVSKSCAPTPYGWHGPDVVPDLMLPFFGAQSTGLSRWIPLGLARVQSDGSEQPVDLRFGGTDPATAAVLRAGESQVFEASLIPPQTLGAPGVLPYIAPDAIALVVRASSLLDEVYLLNTQLLRSFALLIELDETEDQAAQEISLQVAAASYDPALDELHLIVAGGLSLRDFVGESAAAGPDRQPDPAFTSGFTSDIDDLDELIQQGSESKHPAFFRFRVDFNLDAQGAGLTSSTPRPALEFFRVPIRF